MKIRLISHVHSTWSDGQWSLEKIARTALKYGIHAVLLSEHDKDFTQERLEQLRQVCDKLSNDKFRIIPGIEYSDPENRIHICVINPLIFYGENIEADKLMEIIKKNNDMAIWAHPSGKKAWQYFNSVWADVLIGIEIWNRKEDGIKYSKEGIEYSEKYNLLPFAGLDFHRGKQFFPMWLKVKIDGPLNSETIIKALSGGSYKPVLLGIPVAFFYKTLIGKIIITQLERLRLILVKIIKIIK